jgi:hypothetical protein
MLRQPRRLVHQLRQGAASWVIAQLVVIGLFNAAVYGVIVGSFSGGDQYWAAPVKLALGLLGAGLICLPSLYIFSCLAGARARLIEVAGLVAGLVMLMTLLLIGFAPVAWVFAQSTNSIPAIGADLWPAFSVAGISLAGIKLPNRAAGLDDHLHNGRAADDDCAPAVHR